MSRLVRPFLVIFVATLFANAFAVAQEKLQYDRKTHIEKTRELSRLQLEIRSAPNDALRDGMASEVERLTTEIFDLDLLRLEEQIEKMQIALKEQKADREQLIQQRVDRALDPKAPISGPIGRKATQPNSFVVESMKEQADGSLVARIRIKEPEQRMRMVNYTVTVPQTRTRVVNGKEETYTVNVVEPRVKSEPYVVQKLGSKIQQVSIPKGENPKDTISKFVEEIKAAKK